MPDENTLNKLGLPIRIGNLNPSQPDESTARFRDAQPLRGIPPGSIDSRPTGPGFLNPSPETDDRPRARFRDAQPLRGSLAGGGGIRPTSETVPDSIDISSFQSENFITNQITILNLNDQYKLLQVKDIGLNENNGLEIIDRMGELLSQFPTQGTYSVLNLAIEPYYNTDEGMTYLGAGLHNIESRLTFKPENTIGDTRPNYLSTLPFPQYFEEFDIGGNNYQVSDGIINFQDGMQWESIGRVDIAYFVMALYQYPPGSNSQPALDFLQQGYEEGLIYDFKVVHPELILKIFIEGNELPSANGNNNLINLPSYYANITRTRYYFELVVPTEVGSLLEANTFYIPQLSFKLVGPNVDYNDIEEFIIPEEEEVIPEEEQIFGCTDLTADNYNSDATDEDGTCEYLGCTDPTANNYNSSANVNDGTCEYLGCMDSTADNYTPGANVDDGTCTYLDLDQTEEGDGVDEEDPINNIPLDSYSTDEEISEGFGVSGIDIEQTLYNTYDPFSGMDIDTNVFQNTLQSLIDSDSDGRIALGMFAFSDDDNLLKDNFPDILRKPFKQYKTENLVPNPQGLFVRSVWEDRKFGYPDNSNPRTRFFIPSNNWGYCTYDALRDSDKKRNESLYQGGDDFADDDFWGNSIENLPNGSELINSFEQTADGGINNEGGTIDSQGVIGYAGYHAYFFDYGIGDGEANQSLLRLQYNLLNASVQTTNNYDECNKFFMQNQIDSKGLQSVDPPAVSNHSSYITPGRCTAVGNRATDSTNSLPYAATWFPNFAKWIIDKDFNEIWESEVSCYSHGRCLEFLATNFRSGHLDDNDSSGAWDTTTNTFKWSNSTSMNVSNGGVTENQYRSLNQIIKIYNPYIQNKDTLLNPFTIMEVKFKMKSLDLFVPETEQYKGIMYDASNPPQVEIAIVDGDGSTMNPSRTKDRASGGRELPYAYQHGYWPHGDFNSTRYSDDLNEEGTLNRKYSNFGSMGRFQNTEPNKWETFSYKFTMGEVFQFGDGIVRPLWLLVQAAGEFYGRVLLDDFEVYESYDFIPDVDVRKKKSVGNYGIADLTKYYDKDLQSEEYKDSQAPLEAQFYFYPQHPSDKIFDVKRTPIYNDFKKGKFYIYDINWGDETPNEFTSNPEQIDEETALYHTYESSGTFEVTGTMIRMKINIDGKEVGIAKNKIFKLRINVNDGLDEDFLYFGSNGFSFIPYKNTSPIIGGYSEQSIYYKAIKRQLGFITDSQKTQVVFANDGDKLKTEIAIDKMDSSFTEDLDLLNEYKIQRDINGEIIYNGIKSYSGELGKSIGDTDITNIKYYNKPKQMSEMLGFEVPNIDDFTSEYGGELITNGDFSTGELDGGWNTGGQDASKWSYSNGTARLESNNNESAHLYQNDIFEVGQTYIIKFDAVVTLGSCKLEKGGGGVLIEVDTTKTYELEYVADRTSFLFNRYTAYTSNIITLDNISVREKINTESIEFETQEEALQASSLIDPGNPESPRYWKNIIPKDYSIYNREGINLQVTPPVDIFVEQEWLNTSYYYPVLPNYGLDGTFVEGDFTNDKIPFPLEAAITDELESNESLLINIISNKVEGNVFNDNSGNENLGFNFIDYKPIFDNETSKPKKRRNTDLMKTSTNNGAF